MLFVRGLRTQLSSRAPHSERRESFHWQTFTALWFRVWYSDTGRSFRWMLCLPLSSRSCLCGPCCQGCFSQQFQFRLACQPNQPKDPDSSCEIEAIFRPEIFKPSWGTTFLQPAALCLDVYKPCRRRPVSWTLPIRIGFLVNTPRNPLIGKLRNDNENEGSDDYGPKP